MGIRKITANNVLVHGNAGPQPLDPTFAIEAYKKYAEAELERSDGSSDPYAEQDDMPGVHDLTGFCNARNT